MEIDKYILENNHENQCSLLKQAVSRAARLLLECDQRLARVLIEYGDPYGTLTLILEHSLSNVGSHSIATRLLSVSTRRYRGRQERKRAHDRARKRVERLVKRYSRLLELLETHKPPACSLLDPPFRPKGAKTQGTGGQTTSSTEAPWPPRLGPTQRLIIEILAFYEARGALIGNIIHDAQIEYGVRLTYHQVAGALKRLLKRGLVQRLERGRYILTLPSNTLTLASRIMVENVRLSSPHRKEPLERRSEDHYTLYDIAVEASRERANHVDTLELYMPITIHRDLLKKLLSSDGKRIVRVYYNSEQDIVKMELQVYKAKSRLGITTLHEWTSSYIIDLFVAAALIILTLVTKRGVRGIIPDSAFDPCFIGKLLDAVRRVRVVAR